MQSVTNFFSEIFNNTSNLLKLISILVAIFLAITPKLYRWWQNYRDRQSLRKRLGADLYTRENILNATQYYIKPYCQDVDPTQEEEIRAVHGVQADLFETIDKQLANPKKYKFMIVLADSGMGKTSFVLNYYARYWRSSRRRRQYKLALVPLGIPDADSYIKNFPDQSNTVLFLDAFDEDTRAIDQDCRQRLGELFKLCTNFRQILITSRTQFFRQEEEIPREVTGIVKVAVVDAGESRQYQFYKLYLSPFSDAQVNRYLKRRFSLWKRNQRRKAKKLVDKIPLLTVRPMLLAHIKDLAQSGKTFQYSFQIYEEMVAAWLEREEPFVKNKAGLRKFSEQLAIDLYLNAKARGAERIHYSELEPLAKRFGIALADWQLRGRSLLNRDGAGNYKFAHRSIMEYLFVKRFLELKPEERTMIGWTDQIKIFFVEMLRYCWESHQRLPNLTHVDLEGIKIKLRSESKTLREEEVKQMLKQLNFFDKDRNKQGMGILHLYLKSGEKEKVIFDLSTGLMWQQSGSSKYMEFDKVQKSIEKLNREKYASYQDWRLPTLEEAMSLMEPEKKSGNLYIDPVFDGKQEWIWTSDLVKGESRAWSVYFYTGYCSLGYIHDVDYGDGFVRVVRSGQSTIGGFLQ